jgi:Carboxypeptidase regulatory-like domain/TonB dependent receptor-like, beta-barrel/TonB-dependent Receptor Plug Domain
MISLRQLAGGVAAVAIVASFAGQATAQQTTSNIRGAVTNSKGAGVSGAQVTVLHVPSGSVRQITTGANGIYNARGLRPGGPYIVTVTAPGNAPYRVEGLFLSLADTKRLNIALDDVIREDAIVVTASAIGGGNMTMGVNSRFGLDTIEGTPTVTRDFKDVLKYDPNVYLDPTNQNAISIAGGSSRTLSITVDGVAQNDDFGLNNSGFPTLRSPISIDAIDQLSVETTPFDVEFSGFQSGSVNVVTKSGTNEFHGSAFGFRRNSSFTGGGLNVDEWTYGGTFGGPIIKDKLFFFASYDRFEGTNVFDTGPAGGGFVNEVSRVTIGDVNQVNQIAQDVYGFDALGFNPSNLKEIDEKILAKLDWNINENHRASFTMQRDKGNQLRPQNTGGSNIGLLSTWYNNSQKLRSYSGQVFSDWTDNFSTELKVAFKKSPTSQASLGGTDFGLFRVRTAGGGSVFLGPDFFRQANALTNKTLSIKAKANYTVGAHLFTAGYEHVETDVFNLFVPGSRGSYTFNSIADFAAQNASGGLFYQNAVTNNANDGSATFTFKSDSLYVQDQWDVSDTVTIQAGVRYEAVSSTKNIVSNPIFAGRYGFDNTATLSGRDIFLPRVGINWTATDRLSIHGGVGLFAGGNPNVWISNNYSNNGVTIDSIFLPGFLLPPVDGFNVPDVAQNGLVAGDGNVNALDPNFNIPSQWKASAGFDFDTDIGFLGSALGDGWRFSSDIILSSVKDATYWKELTCGTTPTGTAPDGRPVYNCDPSRFDLLLTNTGIGHGRVISFLAEKTFFEDLNFRTSYSNQNIVDANSGTSSTATSNYGKSASSDPLTPTAATSNYERKHRFTFNFDYRHKFIGDNETRFTLFGESRSGQPFSYTFDDPGSRGIQNIFGENRDFARRDRALFYVPTGPNDPIVTYAPGFDQAAFTSFLASSGLDKYAGQIAPRNAFRSSWVNRWDLSIKQEIPGIFPNDAKGIFSMDIRNIGNLIDGSWGQYNQVFFPYVQPVVEATVVGGQYVYSDFTNTAVRSNGTLTRSSTSSTASNWSIQFGLKYKF